MKGLFLGLLEKKEEGYDFARQAIKYNFKSHVCKPKPSVSFVYVVI
jgi:hypothetical protein